MIIHCSSLQYLKVSESRKQILKFSFEPKPNKNIFTFHPYFQKRGQGTTGGEKSRAPRIYDGNMYCKSVA